MTGQESTGAVLLSLDTRAQAGLEWLRQWAREHITRLKRRRKYALPRGADFDPAEANLLVCLLTLERAAEEMLTMAKKTDNSNSQEDKMNPEKLTEAEHDFWYKRE